jgi:hypothetical protein
VIGEIPLQSSSLHAQLHQPQWTGCLNAPLTAPISGVCATSAALRPGNPLHQPKPAYHPRRAQRRCTHRIQRAKWVIQRTHQRQSYRYNKSYLQHWCSYLMVATRFSLTTSRTVIPIILRIL